jgi:hypothetical protein
MSTASMVRFRSSRGARGGVRRNTVGVCGLLRDNLQPGARDFIPPSAFP